MTRPRLARPLLGTLAYVALLVVVLVLPTGGRHHWRGYLQEYDLKLNRRLVADVVVNLAAFVPLGWGLHRTGRALGLAPATILAAVGLVVMLFSLTMEAVQYFLPRYSSLTDVIANTAGGVLGAWWEGRTVRT